MLQGPQAENALSTCHRRLGTSHLRIHNPSPMRGGCCHRASSFVAQASSNNDKTDFDMWTWASVEIHVMPPCETSSLMIFNLEMNFSGLYQAGGSSTDTTEVVQ